VKTSFHAFSLIEVVVSLAIFVFAILGVFSLLPIGIKSNKVSTEEARAADLLTLLEADLRNTSPALAAGKSQYFGLPLPYTTNSAGKTVLNTSLTANTLNSIGLNDDDTVAAYSSTNPRPLYQLSVIYTYLPTAGSLAPIRARLIVNWPAINPANVNQLTSSSNVVGFVETYVTIPAP